MLKVSVREGDLLQEKTDLLIIGMAEDAKALDGAARDIDKALGGAIQALLASDPADRRVREFIRLVEREHVAALYRDLPPLFVPALVDDADALSMLRPEERHVASLLNGRWDVSTVVLASQNRELETLKCLSKLARMGALRAAEVKAAPTPKTKAPRSSGG